MAKPGKPLEKDTIMVGQLVQDMHANVGTVRWCGKMEKAQKPPNGDTGFYCAVEFEEPTQALHRGNGTWEGTEYCKCRDGTVEFLKPKMLVLERNRAALAEFRKVVPNIMPPLPDRELLKFLIARKYEIPKSAEMLENHLKWLAEFKPNKDEYFPPELCDWYPCGFGDGRDRDGNLLYFERPGNGGVMSPKAVCEKLSVGVLARWHAASMMTGRDMMRRHNAKRITMVVDLKDMGDTGSLTLDFAKAVAKIDQDNFPEHLARLYLINASTMFSALWRIIRVFVDDRTKDKIRVLKGDFAEEVEKQIDKQYWPKFLGGENDSWLAKNGRVGSEDPSKAAAGGPALNIDPVTKEELAEAEKPTPRETAASPEPGSPNPSGAAEAPPASPGKDV